MRKVFSSVTLVPLLLLVASGTGLAQWNGEIVGWGNNDEGQCDFEGESYIAIAAGGHFGVGWWYPENHSLGLSDVDSIETRGTNGCGQCNVPEPNEDFVAIAAEAFTASV